MTAAASYTTNHSSLTLNIADYPGGVAIWGALPAVFDTSTQGFDRGVHVHARLSPTSKKSIDDTFEIVNVIWGDSQFIINEETAVNFSLASIFNHNIISLRCERCHQPILSSQLLSLIPHHEHICHDCGYINITTDACVVNPVIELKEKLGDKNIKRKTVLPNRDININYDKYPGGVQIWGSNPSIIWTAERLEESAIHVHAYQHHAKRIVDNTYSNVYIDGDYLDIEMIRILQIQQCIPEINTSIDVITCPGCGKQQFDRGIHAVIPQTSRRCATCSTFFITRAPTISNPVHGILNKINGNKHA